MKTFPETLAYVYNKPEFLKLSDEQCIDILRPDEEAIAERWIESNRKDYSIYQDPIYPAGAFICYHFATKVSINNMLQYFMQNVPGCKQLAMFDDHNGVGMSTASLINEGFDVSYRNTNDIQTDVFKQICDLNDYDLPKKDNELKGTYDIVLSFETIEHYLDPISYIDEIFHMTKVGGYLVLGTGFGSPKYPGHFEYFQIHGKPILHSHAWSYVLKYLENEKNCEVVYEYKNENDNNRPIILKRNG